MEATNNFSKNGMMKYPISGYKGFKALSNNLII